MLADWYNTWKASSTAPTRLAKLQTLWGDANVVNKIPGWIEGVTSADVQRAAATYLTQGQPHRHRPQAGADGRARRRRPCRRRASCSTNRDEIRRAS